MWWTKLIFLTTLFIPIELYLSLICLLTNSNIIQSMLNLFNLFFSSSLLLFTLFIFHSLFLSVSVSIINKIINSRWVAELQVARNQRLLTSPSLLLNRRKWTIRTMLRMPNSQPQKNNNWNHQNWYRHQRAVSKLLETHRNPYRKRWRQNKAQQIKTWIWVAVRKQ